MPFVSFPCLIAVARTLFHWSFLFLSLFYFSFFDLYCFLPSANFGLCSFSNSFSWQVRLFIWDFSCFLRYTYITINFPLRSAFVLSHRFWKVVFFFSLVSKYFLISSSISSLIHWFLVVYFCVFTIFLPVIVFLVSYCDQKKKKWYNF